MNTRKLLALLLTAVLLLTGCGGQEQDQAEPKATRQVRCLTGATLQAGEYNMTTSVSYGPEGISIKAQPVNNTAEHLYDLQGRLIRTTYYDENGEIIYISAYSYNEDGLLALEKATEPDGSPRATYTYTYDASGHKIKYTRQDANGNISETIQYTYDANGNLICEENFDYTGSVSHRYDYTVNSSGKTERMDWFDMENGKLVLEGYFAYSYDAEDRLISRVWFTEAGDVISNSEYYTYDSQGRLSTYQSCFEQEQECSNEYIYDEDGYLIQVKDLCSQSVSTYHYETLQLEEAVAAAAERWSCTGLIESISPLKRGE